MYNIFIYLYFFSQTNSVKSIYNISSRIVVYNFFIYLFFNFFILFILFIIERFGHVTNDLIFAEKKFALYEHSTFTRT